MFEVFTLLCTLVLIGDSFNILSVRSNVALLIAYLGSVWRNLIYQYVFKIYLDSKSLIPNRLIPRALVWHHVYTETLELRTDRIEVSRYFVAYFLGLAHAPVAIRSRRWWESLSERVHRIGCCSILANECVDACGGELEVCGSSSSGANWVNSWSARHVAPIPITGAVHSVHCTHYLCRFRGSVTIGYSLTVLKCLREKLLCTGVRRRLDTLYMALLVPKSTFWNVG